MIVERIEESMPGAVLGHNRFRGDLTVEVSPEGYPDVVKFIFGEGYQLMIDLTAVDWLGRPDRKERFDLVVHFQNLVSQERLRVKVKLDDGQAIASITGIHKTADWFEREVFDMFGIHFEGHPNLKRLMMWDDFEGHPLRKDFPLYGGDPWCGSGMGAPFPTAGGGRKGAGS